MLAFISIIYQEVLST